MNEDSKLDKLYRVVEKSGNVYFGVIFFVDRISVMISEFSMTSKKGTNYLTLNTEEVETVQEITTAEFIDNAIKIYYESTNNSYCQYFKMQQHISKLDDVIKGTIIDKRIDWSERFKKDKFELEVFSRSMSRKINDDRELLLRKLSEYIENNNL